MYDKQKTELAEPSHPQHIQFATEIANALMERFDPQEQNEALKHFHSLILKERQKMIDEAEKKSAWLKETIQQL